MKGEAAKPGPAPADAASAEKGTSAADSLLSEIADLASKGAQQGRRNADEVAERVLPAIRLGLGKASYSTGYYVSFGLVLTGKLIVDMLPGSSALRHGINDGGAAAEQAFAVRKDREKATQGTAAAPAAV